MRWLTWADGVNDIDDVKRGVVPPNEESAPDGYVRFDDRISFMNALELAIRFRDDRGSPSLLNALEELYPEDVSALMFLAEEHVKIRSGELMPA